MTLAEAIFLFFGIVTGLLIAVVALQVSMQVQFQRELNNIKEDHFKGRTHRAIEVKLPKTNS